MDTRRVQICNRSRLQAASLLLLLAVGLLVTAQAQTTDPKQCQATCTKPCKNTAKGLQCLTCKRGWARAKARDLQCTVCAKNYGTTIDPTLPLAVRRGFAACKKEPCGRCSVCPQGTSSAGGYPGATPMVGATCRFTLPAPTTIDPGYYWDPYARKVKLCPPDTFAANPRRPKNAGIESCVPCSSLFAFRYTSAAGLLQVAVAAGTPDRQSCSCPENTFWAFDIGANGVRTVRHACVTCPAGTTGGVGATGLEACQGSCRVGYHGDPADPTYNYQCSQCPAPAGSTAPPVTSGVTVAPVQVSDCDTCPYASYQSGASVPAVCLLCDPGYWHGPDGKCDHCASGYQPQGGKCVACGKKFAVNSAWKSPPASGTGDCGGCQAGLYGNNCTLPCEASGRKPADAVSTESWQLPPDPVTTEANCLWGCPPGGGWDPDTKSCKLCKGNTYSPGATQGAPRPECRACPANSAAVSTRGADGAALHGGNNRCVTNYGAADAQSIFDEFD